MHERAYESSESNSDRAWDWSADITNAKNGSEARCAFREYLIRIATIESDIFGAELIFGELMGNIVRHAAGIGSFHLDWQDVHPILLAEDHGLGFREVPMGTLEDVGAESGRGLALIYTYALKISISNRTDGGACVRVILPVERMRN